MKLALGFAALSIAACNQSVPAAPAQNVAAPEAKLPPADATQLAAKPYLLDEKNALIDFHFAWPAEAAAVPQLVDRFQADLAKVKAELIAGAKEDKAWRDKDGLDFHGFMSSTDYRTAGQSPRLLSLGIETGNYTGGAHGNYSAGALIWDRRAGREITNKQLFADPANRDRLLTQRWCDALNKAREEKRGEPVSGNGMFDDCPRLDDIALLPADKDGNGRFEQLVLTASPYVAGSYAEGSYEVVLPVTSDLVASLKSDYRDSFETAQPQ